MLNLVDPIYDHCNYCQMYETMLQRCGNIYVFELASSQGASFLLYFQSMTRSQFQLSRQEREFLSFQSHVSRREREFLSFSLVVENRISFFQSRLRMQFLLVFCGFFLQKRTLKLSNFLKIVCFSQEVSMKI